MEDLDFLHKEDLEAYQTSLRIFARGSSPSQVINIYSELAKKYNETFCPGRYNAPEIAAKEVAARVPEDERQNVKIIDVAAGTGRVGVKLCALGFTMMDALEPSEGMLKLLRETGVYSKKYQEFLGLGQNSVPNGTYDIAVIAGAMGEGHVPISGINDLIRITKPGGLVIIVMREEFLHDVADYKDRLIPHMDSLEQQGYWTKVEVKTIANYAFGKDGIIFTYKVV